MVHPFIYNKDANWLAGFERDTKYDTRRFDESRSVSTYGLDYYATSKYMNRDYVFLHSCPTCDRITSLTIHTGIRCIRCGYHFCTNFTDMLTLIDSWNRHCRTYSK